MCELTNSKQLELTSRRKILQSSAIGFGSLAFASLLQSHLIGSENGGEGDLSASPSPADRNS